MTKITSALAASALLLGLACGKAPADTSRVLANVGGEKITEAEFREMAALQMPADQVEGFMTRQDLASQAQRAQMLGGIAQMKAVTQFAKAQGLDQDFKVRLRLEAAQAQAYASALLERGLGEPTEAQLKAQYDELAAPGKAQGQAVPSFEEVLKTPQLRQIITQAWQKAQQAKAGASLSNQIKAAVPVTFADGYQPVE
jgi:hypothetical protein